MNNPICFSQYFVNKQNVRSFNNVLNSKYLRSENDTAFLKNIFEDEELVSELSTEVKEILFEIRENVTSCSKQDFKNYLVIKDVEYSLRTIHKADVLTSCSNALVKVIPSQFFGNNHNNKIFNKCMKLIIYSMRNQFLYLGNCIVKSWDFSRFPWNTIIDTLSPKILCHILHWIFKIILSAIISLNFYVTTCKFDNDENKLHFFLKNQWQRFYDIRISNMIISKIISRFEPYCIGKKTKTKYNLQERLKLKMLKREIPKLHLVLKCNDDYRPIVRYKNESITTSDKYKIKERLHFLHILTGKSYAKIERHFSVLYKMWIKKNQPKLYFVKTDLSNAFGSISKEKLLKILCERHVEFQKKEKSLYTKKKFAQQYKEIVAELRKPLLIRSGSTIYEWKEGLVQGYKYSPALSELYYSYLDEIYFSEHLKKEDHDLKLFIRVVDDYLYITDSLEDAHLFLKALSNYRNVNFIKTFVNFQHPTIKFRQEITFLGYSYNTANMEVSRANTVFTGDMCYKISFSAAIGNLGKFLENRIGQSGIQINGHIFNFYHNNEELIWHHIFVTLCLSANKFCTILALYCDEKQMSQYLAIYKNRVTVKLCNSIIETLKRNQPSDFIFKYCINHFRYLSFKALLLCAQKTSKCNVLVPYVNVELARSNCIHGKWRDHSSRICKSGKSKMQAIREICKRADLKIIMKKFNDLPPGVQCFNHKKFYQ
ncbi:telomerase reverse transcriptase-like [Vanessa atalanta]|uniref:telomerase reverse transcriptase-like n=1 Tax=Vanessa atalanta TaxID=42275 RepID=UPI001FCDA80D|nr:telomerase reverse transcriptase-like [Vanessa atalanta]